MREQQMQDALVRIYGANDPWAELMLWLKEMAAQNESRGGTQDAFMTFLVFEVMHTSLPINLETGK